MKRRNSRTGMTNSNPQRLTMRIGRNTMAFLAQDELGGETHYEPYVVKSGISMAANLRQAFKSSDMLMQAPQRVRVLIDSDVLMVPVELFNEQSMEDMHNHAFPRQEQDAVYYNVLPDLNAVAVFAVNKDLRLVLDDHFKDVSLIAAVTPVWRYMHRRSFTGPRQKLFGYFHEKRLEVFSFRQNRFKFCNSFNAGRPADALYFLLYVWQQLQLQPAFDELHLMGDLPEQEWLMGELNTYLHKTFVVNPKADFMHQPITEIKGMPYDLMTLVVKGR